MIHFLQAIGLNLENDILSWLTGDFAIFTQYDVPEPGTPSLFMLGIDPDTPVPVNAQIALMIDATDATKAQNLVETLATQLSDAGAPVSRETINGANAIVLALPLPQLATPAEIIIGANDAVFVVGTRAAATAALNGGGNLTADATYTRIAKYLLPEANFVEYLSPEGVTMLADGITAINFEVTEAFRGVSGGTPLSPEERVDLFTTSQQTNRADVAVFAGGTISTTGNPNSDSQLRMTWTLNP